MNAWRKPLDRYAIWNHSSSGLRDVEPKHHNSKCGSQMNNVHFERDAYYNWTEALPKIDDSCR